MKRQTAVSQISSEVAKGSTATQGGVCWIYFSHGRAYAGIISGIKFKNNRLVLEVSELARGYETDQLQCEIDWRRLNRHKDAPPLVFKFSKCAEEEPLNGFGDKNHIEPRVSLKSLEGDTIVLSSVSDDVQRMQKLSSLINLSALPLTRQSFLFIGKI